MMISNQTLIDIIKESRSLPSKGIIFIKGDDEEDFLTYPQLYDLSLKTLALLQKRGIKPKDELVFQVDDNKTFIILFWASVLGGIIPVPVSIGRNSEHKRKLFLIMEILNAPYLVCSTRLLLELNKFSSQENLNKDMTHLVSGHIDVLSVFEEKEYGVEYLVKPHDTAFIQFSSGSTGTPKGVVLTHENLIVNVKAIAKAAKYSEKDSLLSWMPLTHDMGMIGFHINPLVCGINQYIMPTHLFVRKPAFWFDKVSQHRVTVIGAPNFGYSYVLKYCARKSQDWDLSSVRIFYNGAEPISADLCNKFLDKMSVYNLKRTSICPVYGLAEATLAVSMSKLGDEVIANKYQRDKLNVGRKVSITNRIENGIDIVNVGSNVKDCEIRIVDETNNPVFDKVVGYVMIKGKNVTKGYYNDLAATMKVIDDNGWLNTGDLGFIDRKSLYITGRAKDIIFLNGQNYYPHDIEKVAEEVNEVELNKIVVVGYYDTTSEEERIISFVFYRGKIEKFVSVVNEIKSLVSRKMGIEITTVLPVKDIPRTTSGKLQRYKLLQEFLDGKYSVIEKDLEELSKNIVSNKLELPKNEEEKKIAKIWKKILKLKKIGVNQSFYSLGGNSLKLAEMGMELQKEFEVELSLEDFYEMETIRGISESLFGLVKKQFTPIPKVSKTETYPLSYSQKGLYYAWKLDNTSIAYNIPIAIEIKGIIDFKKLEAAVIKTISENPMLKASFVESEEPRFIIKQKSDFKLNVIDCGPQDIDTILRKLIEPYDLFAGNLFKVLILSVSKKRNILFVDFHHIVADGLSLNRFMKQLIEIYNDKTLTKTEIEYTDYIHWQKERLSMQNIKLQEKYWLNHFEEDIPILELPIDNPREKVLTSKGKRIQYEIGKKYSDYLRNLATQQNTTIHNVLFSIYKWFLTKLSGQRNSIIGIPVSGRTHIDLQDIFGMFVNNLPIKSETIPDESFLASMSRDSEMLINALKNQEYPYAKLIEELGLTRDVSRNPLFDTMFLFTPEDLKFDAGVLKLEHHFFDTGCSKFDFSIEIIERDSIAYIMEYSNILFEESTIERFSEYFMNLIKTVVNNPEILFRDTSILSHKEYLNHVESFRALEKTFYRTENVTIVSLFEDQVISKPQQIALEFENNQVDFKMLNEAAEGYRLSLENKGVLKGDIVGVCLKRSPELVGLLLGILKIGAVYLPIEYTAPTERIDYIIKDSRSKLLVCSSLETRFNSLTVEQVYIEDELPDTSDLDTLRNQVNGANDLAYIIYTSGTTGVPKGVMISHKSLLNYVSWACNEYLGTGPAVFALFTSLGFDLTLTSIFLPLVSGNRIVIYENEDEEELVTLFREDKVTHLKLTPSHLKMVINNNLIPPSRLEKIIVGGEKLLSDVASRFVNLCEQEMTIYNEYGPTEATIGCMIHKFNPSEDNISVPIGIPISNCKIYLLDEFLNPVPFGVVGELYISGDCLATGYLNNNFLTKQKFLSNPFTGKELMYKSGDLAKKMPSGKFVFVGRQDNQIKIKGFRIEKEEIRRILMDYNGIDDVEIASNEDNVGKLELYAFYIANTEICQVDLKSFLLKKLPYYMVPSYFVKVRQIPLNNNGKVDYGKLLSLKQEERTKNYEESALDKSIIQIYNEVFDETEIDLETNFYELGGDSIKATQIASKLYQKNIKITPREILVYNTIEQLVHYIKENSKTFFRDTNTFQGLVSGEKNLTPIESWFSRKNFHNPNFYNQSILLELKKEINKKVLEDTFKTLIAHHDGLRLNFDKTKQTLFFNNNHLKEEFSIDTFFVKSEVELKRLLEDVKRSFKLDKSMLIKVALIHYGSKLQSSEMLFITAHHLVIDGLSWRILMEDMYKVYHSLLEKKKFLLPKKTASLITFKEELDLFVSEKRIDEEITYWKSIEEIDFKIPLDFETDDWLVENSSAVYGQLDENNTNWLLSESWRCNIDILTLLKVALGQALRQWTGAKLVKIEIENHGRHIEKIDVSRTVGWFTVMHPIVFNLGDNLRENIKEVKEIIKNIPNHGIGYGILDAMETFGRKEKDYSDVRFNYLGQFGKELSNDFFGIKKYSTGRESDTNNSLTARLEINAMVLEKKLQLEFLYNSLAHKKSTIDRFKTMFFKALLNLITVLKNNEEYLLTPSDFETISITQGELDSLFD